MTRGEAIAPIALVAGAAILVTIMFIQAGKMDDEADRLCIASFARSHTPADSLMVASLNSACLRMLKDSAR